MHILGFQILASLGPYKKLYVLTHIWELNEPSVPSHFYSEQKLYSGTTPSSWSNLLNTSRDSYWLPRTAILHYSWSWPLSESRFNLRILSAKKILFWAECENTVIFITLCTNSFCCLAWDVKTASHMCDWLGERHSSTLCNLKSSGNVTLSFLNAEQHSREKERERKEKGNFSLPMH